MKEENIAYLLLIATKNQTNKQTSLSVTKREFLSFKWSMFNEQGNAILKSLLIQKHTFKTSEASFKSKMYVYFADDFKSKSIISIFALPLPLQLSFLNGPKQLSNSVDLLYYFS